MKRTLLFIGIIGLTGYLSSNFFTLRDRDAYNTIISPLAESIFPTSPIEKKINDVIAQRKGTYAVFYKDLVTKEVYTIHAQKEFEAASLYKLWIMGETFRQIDAGKIKKEDILKESVENLNKKFNIASESAEKKEGDIELSVEDALEKMITVSDNYAALLLSAKVRLSHVTGFLQTHELTHSSIGVPPKTTVSDIGKFFEKLYRGEIVGQIYSKEMLAILQRQRLNDRLPKYLPDTVHVAHKTGELGKFKHDGGIVYAITGPYILVILSESDDPSYAAETIAILSKDMYELKMTGR